MHRKENGTHAKHRVQYTNKKRPIARINKMMVDGGFTEPPTASKLRIIVRGATHNRTLIKGCHCWHIWQSAQRSSGGRPDYPAGGNDISECNQSRIKRHFPWQMWIMRDIRTQKKKRHLVTASLCSIYIQLRGGGRERDTHTHISGLCLQWYIDLDSPCLWNPKLESLRCPTDPCKCLVAVLLVLIRKRTELAGLSEVINIRGHKAMLIEWSPHCHAVGVSPFTPFPSQSFPFQSDSPIPSSLVCLSYKSLGDPPSLALAFPTDSSKKTSLVWSGWRSCWESLAPVWIQISGSEESEGFEGNGLTERVRWKCTSVREK